MISQNALYIGIASLTDCPTVRGGLARIPLDDPTHPQPLGMPLQFMVTGEAVARTAPAARLVATANRFCRPGGADFLVRKWIKAFHKAIG